MSERCLTTKQKADYNINELRNSTVYSKKINEIIGHHYGKRKRGLIPLKDLNDDEMKNRRYIIRIIIYDMNKYEMHDPIELYVKIDNDENWLNKLKKKLHTNLIISNKV